jgi:putative ABC transport system permease protein
MGVRLALGATPRSLIVLTMRRTLTPTVAGISIGLIATRWFARLAEAQLYDVDARDSVTLAATVVTVALAALVASYLPARRASRIDPMAVLRME